MGDLEQLTDAAIIDTEEKPKQPVKRYAADGQTEIQTGAIIGHANRQQIESPEDRKERLTPEDDQLDEAIDGILGEVEQAKVSYGVEDEEGISTLEELDGLVNQATLATKLAAEQVVAANPRSLVGQIEAQHEEAFRAAMYGEQEQDEEDFAGALVEVEAETKTEPDRIIRVDEAGRSVYWDAEKGEEYVLTPQQGEDDDRGLGGFYPAGWDDAA